MNKDISNLIYSYIPPTGFLEWTYKINEVNVEYYFSVRRTGQYYQYDHCPRQDCLKFMIGGKNGTPYYKYYVSHSDIDQYISNKKIDIGYNPDIYLKSMSKSNSDYQNLEYITITIPTSSYTTLIRNFTNGQEFDPNTARYSWLTGYSTPYDNERGYKLSQYRYNKMRIMDLDYRDGWKSEYGYKFLTVS